MALFNSLADAYAAYSAALPWQQSLSAAQTALSAINYLFVNRAQATGDEGTTFNFESLGSEKKALEQFLGATAPRAFGRSRRNAAAFPATGGVA